MKKPALLLVVIILIGLSSYAQNTSREASIWYFGDGGGLDFSSNPPTALTNGAIQNQWEGTASVADSEGNLLFYTDGVSVWDKNHSIMPNGNGLGGNISTSQPAIIVPHPGNTSIYFIFTVDELAQSNGVKYSQVDLSLSGNGTSGNSLGDVTATKNVALFSPGSEKITAVRHSNNKATWVITHEWNTNTFRSYLIDCSGLNTTPVLSSVGLVHDPITGSAFPNTNAIGYLKASSNGNKIGSAIYTEGAFEVFDFDRSTGVLSNPITFSNPNYFRAYGVEFSSDETKFYGSTGDGEIFQADLSAGNDSAVVASFKLIGQSAGPISSRGLIGGALQLARNGKIYYARDENDYLGVINNPNELGVAANYVDDGQLLAFNTESGIGLPNFVQSYLGEAVIDFTGNGACVGDAVDFTVVSSANITSYSWDFGDGGSSTSASPSHTYSSAGTYNVELTYSDGCFTGSITKPISVIPAGTKPVVAPIPDMCEGETAFLELISGPSGGNWKAKQMVAGGLIEIPLLVTYNIFTPLGSGDYKITYVPKDACAPESDPAFVTVHAKPNASFTSFGPLCDNDVAVDLNNTASPVETGGSWSGVGVVGNNYDPSVAGPGNHQLIYSITNANGCSSSYSETITINDAPDITISTTGPFCIGSGTQTLQATPSGGTWSGNSVSGSTFDPAIAGVGIHNISYTTGGLGCDATETISIDVIASPDATISAIDTLCSKDSPITLAAASSGGSWFGNGVDSSGIFDPTISGIGNHTIIYSVDVGGCSDIDSVQITVENAPFNVGHEKICNGDSIFLEGIYQKTSGVYQNIFSTNNYCDSIVETTLEVLPVFSFSSQLSLCLGDSIYVQNAYQKAAGIYYDTLQTVLGCDSVNAVNLVVVDTIKVIKGIASQSTGLPLENAKIYLIELDSANNTIIAIDSTETDNNGTYQFKTYASEVYIKAVPDSATYPNEIPSYFDSVLVFTEAMPITPIYCDTLNEIDIVTIAGINLGGSGFISGIVGAGTGKATSCGDPIVNASLILMNENNKAVQYTYTNQLGEFLFTNLAVGSYKIWIDLPYVTNTISHMFTIDGNNNLQNVNLEVTEVGLEVCSNIITSLKHEQQIIGSIKVYPNPARNILTIEKKENTAEKVIFTNLIGEEIFSFVLKSSIKQLDISTLAPGVYFITNSNTKHKLVVY